MVPESAHTLLASMAGDAPSYLDPIDNFIEKGAYYIQYGERTVYMGRAPYYGSFYFVFRLWASKEVAYDLLVLLQIFIESVSILYLSRLAQKMVQSPRAFWITWLLMVLSMNSTHTANNLQTESLSISFLIIFSFYYYAYLTEKKRKYLWLAGLFLSITVLLKPYFGVLFVPVGIRFLFARPLKFRQVVANTFVVSFFLIFFTIPYTVRNLVRFKKVMPLSEFYAGYSYTPTLFSYWNFVTAWGGSYVFWDKRSAGCYFEPQPGLPCEFRLPAYAVCKGYGREDIERVRDMYLRLQAMPYNKALDDSVRDEFNRLTALYKKYRPVRYYLVSPLLRMKQFVFYSGSYYLPIRADSPCYKGYQFILKITQSFLYYFTLFAGFGGLLWMCIKRPDTRMFFFIPLFLILFFPLYVKGVEFRYFLNSYPFFMLGSVVCCTQLYRLFLRHNNKASSAG